MVPADTPDPLFSEPADGDRIGDEELLAMLEAAIADERAAQEKYRRGFSHCADGEACRMFEQLMHDEETHERTLAQRYTEVKKRVGLSGTTHAD